LVNLVEDWEVLEKYAGDKRGFYQVLGNDDLLEVRVLVGKLGFRKEFKNKDDPLLTHILGFCKIRGYIKVSESVREEFFFK